jgi:hypothetical protein
MPNSLELLRRFGPALDFPTKDPAKHVAPALRDNARHRARGQTPSLIVKVRDASISAFRSIGNTELLLGSLSVTAIALLAVLGLMALSGSGGFVYGKF